MIKWFYEKVGHFFTKSQNTKEVKAEGNILFYNYKEPLRQIEGGFGYMGTIGCDKNTGKIQCHICGLTFGSLGTHINRKHSLTGKEYKKKFGLSGTTALLGESTREKYIQNSKTRFPLPHRFKKGERKGGNYNKSPRSLEWENKRGSCPDQLLDKIRTLKDKLGRTPESKEFRAEYPGFGLSIRRTFGSWRNALKMLNMVPRGEYSNEQLLQYFTDFYKINKRVPVDSDARRGLIPSIVLYTRQFGTLNEARRLAGIPILERRGRGVVEVMMDIPFDQSKY